MKSALLLAIRGYQLVVSPLLGQNCRFYPSCSNYALEAIQLHGAGKGSWLAARRLCKCHPWNAGGVDPVPAKTTATPANQVMPSEQVAEKSTSTPTLPAGHSSNLS